MKRNIVVAAITLFVLTAAGCAGSKNNNATASQREATVDSLMAAKEFKFVAKTALPLGYRSVDLFNNPNSVKFQPELIESDMPYFGRAYSGVGYGNDAGLKFKGKPEEFSVNKNNNMYDVNAVVKSENETYRMFLTVQQTGNATLTIQSVNRNSISYNGQISRLENPGAGK